jgi:hypothetical protein
MAKMEGLNGTAYGSHVHDLIEKNEDELAANKCQSRYRSDANYDAYDEMKSFESQANDCDIF